jgi:hypothetical protein
MISYAGEAASKIHKGTVGAVRGDSVIPASGRSSVSVHGHNKL